MLKKIFLIFLLLTHIVAMVVAASQLIVYLFKIIDNKPVTEIPWILALIIISTGVLINFIFRKQAPSKAWKSPIGMLIFNLLAAIYFATTQDHSILPFMTLSISLILVRLSEGHFVHKVFAKPTETTETKEE